MNAETPLMNLIRLEASRHGAVLFRNLVGKFKTMDDQWVRCGLGPGSPDLIGWCCDGRFLAIEVKTPGAHTAADRLAAQNNFIEAVLRAGGRAGFADSAAAAARIICGN